MSNTFYMKKGKKQEGISGWGSGCEDGIKTDLMEKSVIVDWDSVIQNSVQCWTQLNTAINLWVPQTAGNLKMAVFWNTTSCGLVAIYRRFREIYYLHHQGSSLWWMKKFLSKHLSIYTILYGIFQKTTIIILVAVKTSNLINNFLTRRVTINF